MVAAVDTMVLAALSIEPQDEFFFSVDHCFLIGGQGTVMTGTVLAGSVSVGQVSCCFSVLSRANPNVTPRPGVCVFMCVYVCLCVFMCVYVYVCVYICI